MSGRTWSNGTGEPQRGRGGQHAPARGRETAPAPQAAPRPAPEAQALVKANTGAFRDLARLNEAVTALQSVANVVTPIAVLADVPDGCSVVLAPVAVNPLNPGETYTAGRLKVDGAYVDTYGLSKASLLRIAAAAGVSVVDSRRMDKGRNPLVVCWSVTVKMTNVHGETVQNTGSVELDLTDGSPEAEALLGPSRAQKSLDQQRRFIVRIAESKATLRAIRALLSLPTALTNQQLHRPFVAVKVVFDGSFASEDLRREYARARIAQATGAENLLMGRRPAPPPSIEAPEAFDGEHRDPSEVLDAELADEPAPEPGPQVELDAHGWPVGHPLSADVLLHLAERKGAGPEELKACADWLAKNRSEPARQKCRERFEAKPDPADDDNDPIPF